MLVSRIPENVQRHLDDLKTQHGITTNAKMITFLILQSKAREIAFRDLSKTLDQTREDYGALLNEARDFVNAFSSLKKSVKR